MMKNVLFAMLVVVVLIGLAGCRHTGGYAPGGYMVGSCSDVPGDCGSCGNGCDPSAAMGQGMGQITYPYYTTRGPRDFLAENPRSPGP